MATVAARINAVNWFEIPVSDMGRARKFYENVFGLKLELNTMEALEMAWFPMHQDAPGAAGSLMKGPTYEPSRAGTMVYFSVDDISEVLRRAVANGGKVLLPKQSIGEWGFIGHFEDPEGNRVAVHSMQ